MAVPHKPSLDCKLLGAGRVVPALRSGSATPIETHWNIRKTNVEAELQANTLKEKLQSSCVISVEQLI